MRKALTLVMAVVALVATGGTGALAQTGGAGAGPAALTTVSVPLMEQNGSGESGVATLTAMGDQTQVVIKLSPGTLVPADTPQPAHFHLGTCANLDPKPLQPLNNIVNGTSTSMVPLTFDAIMNQQMAINVHKSATEVDVYVSCGDATAAVKAAMMQAGSGTGGPGGTGTGTGTGTETGGTGTSGGAAGTSETGTSAVTVVTVPMMAENGSGQDGTATLTLVGGQVQVAVNLSNGTSTPQPAHIHLGTCANLDPKPLQPLSNVVNGTSTTTVPLGFADMMNQQMAVNVHKSATEVAVYTSCGDITPAVQAAFAAATGGTVGMPTTGSGDVSLVLLALTLLATALVGGGLALSRRRS